MVQRSLFIQILAAAILPAISILVLRILTGLDNLKKMNKKNPDSQLLVPITVRSKLDDISRTNKRFRL
jgi:hypothetical protein